MNENTSTTTNQTAPKTFDIIDGNTLMAQEYEPLWRNLFHLKGLCPLWLPVMVRIAIRGMGKIL